MAEARNGGPARPPSPNADRVVRALLRHWFEHAPQAAGMLPGQPLEARVEAARELVLGGLVTIETDLDADRLRRNEAFSVRLRPTAAAKALFGPGGFRA